MEKPKLLKNGTTEKSQDSGPQWYHWEYPKKNEQGIQSTCKIHAQGKQRSLQLMDANQVGVV